MKFHLTSTRASGKAMELAFLAVPEQKLAEIADGQLYTVAGEGFSGTAAKGIRGIYVHGLVQAGSETECQLTPWTDAPPLSGFESPVSTVQVLPESFAVMDGDQEVGHLDLVESTVVDETLLSRVVDAKWFEPGIDASRPDSLLAEA